MNRTQKEQEVKTLNSLFASAENACLLDFRGLSVPAATEFRKKARESGTRYKVVKNTLALLAAKGTSLEQLEEHFSGQTGVALSSTDPVVMAKLIRDFAKDVPALKIKAGVIGGKVVDAQTLEAMADMPTRVEMFSMMAAMFKAPVTRLARVLKAPLNKACMAMTALKQKQES